MAIFEKGKIYRIAYEDIKKQSTSWLNGVKKLLTRLREAGEEVPDYDLVRKEVNEELEKRLAARGSEEASVAQISPEKMRDVR